MDGKTLARIGAIVAAVIDMNRPDDHQADFTVPGPAVIGRDPLDAELARCSGLGEAGPRDPSCLKAWVENRHRFLGQPAAAIAPTGPSDTPASVHAPAMSGAR